MVIFAWSLLNCHLVVCWEWGDLWKKAKNKFNVYLGICIFIRLICILGKYKSSKKWCTQGNIWGKNNLVSVKTTYGTLSNVKNEQNELRRNFYPLNKHRCFIPCFMWFLSQSWQKCFQLYIFPLKPVSWNPWVYCLLNFIVFIPICVAKWCRLPTVRYGKAAYHASVSYVIFLLRKHILPLIGWINPVTVCNLYCYGDTLAVKTSLRPDYEAKTHITQLWKMKHVCSSGSHMRYMRYFRRSTSCDLL